MTLMFLAAPAAPPAVVRRREENTAEPTRVTLPEAQRRGRGFLYADTEGGGTAPATAVARWVQAEQVQGEKEARRRIESFGTFLKQINTLVADESNFDDECLAPTFRSTETML